MKLREAIAYLKENESKEYQALDIAIQEGLPASEICKSLQYTIKTTGNVPQFQERILQRMVKSIKEGEKTLNDYTA